MALIFETEKYRHKTDVIDTEDDTLKDIECVNCKAILATSIKDLLSKSHKQTNS